MLRGLLKDLSHVVGIVTTDGHNLAGQHRGQESHLVLGVLLAGVIGGSKGGISNDPVFFVVTHTIYGAEKHAIRCSNSSKTHNGHTTMSVLGYL